MLSSSIRVAGVWLAAASLALGGGVAASSGLGQASQPGSAGSPQRSGQSSSQTGSAAASSPAATIEVVGRVVDARNQQPIGRALVRFGTRAMLTDHDGNFDFAGVTASAGSFAVMKPGYYPTPDGEGGSPRSYRFPVSSPIELPLYPEAILSGSAVDSMGESLAQLNVVARRSVFDENGHRWAITGQTQTASDGSFRMTVPAGVYSVLVSQYGRPMAGTEIVLPVSIPPVSSSLNEAIHLGMGEEVHLDVRPESRLLHRVDLTMEPEMRGFPMVTARMANGLSFPLSATPSRGETRGELHVALPSGSYTLLASMQNQEGLAEAKTQVTVTDHDLSGLSLKFSAVPSLPVVIETDAGATVDSTTKLPEPMQLGLVLHPVGDAADANGQTYGVMPRRNGAPAFSVPGGVYRLRAQAAGQWAITSATCGGVDLLSQDLPVSPDLSGTEIRVRVSNQTATVSGTVTLNGVPRPAWVYLVATTPSATPVVTVRSGSDGSFVRPYLAAGSYRVVALGRRIQADMQSAATLERFLDRIQTFTVSGGEQRTLNLQAVSEQEMPQ